MNDPIDIKIAQGSDWNYVAFIQNDPVNPSNPINPANAVNLTGCSAVMTAVAYLGSPVNIFQLSTANGSLVINAEAGSVSWDMPAATTSTFSISGLPYSPLSGGAVFFMGYYTMKIMNSAGAVMREFSGKLYLDLDV